MAPALDRLIICYRKRLLHLMFCSGKTKSVEVLPVEGGLQPLGSCCCCVKHPLQRGEESSAIAPEGQGPGVTNLIVVSPTRAKARRLHS